MLATVLFVVRSNGCHDSSVCGCHDNIVVVTMVAKTVIETVRCCGLIGRNVRMASTVFM